MKMMPAANEPAASKISFYHLALFLALLPFDYFYSQLVLVSFGIHTLIHLQKKSGRFLLKKETWLPALLFFVLLLSTLYSPDKKEGLDISGRQAALLVMPVLFALNSINLARYKMKLLLVFAVTCCMVVLYLYANALYTIHYFHLPATTLFTPAFTNHNFSAPIALHATYLAMYTALSAAILLFCFAKTRSIQLKICYGAGLLLLVCSLVQLGSRAVVVALLLIIFAACIFWVQGKKRWIVAGCTLVLSIVTGAFILQNNSFHQRYVSELKNDLGNLPVADENLEPRIVRWQLALALIKKSPVLGYGNGAEKQLLKEQYFEHKLYVSFLKEFNAHNQLLSILLRCGIGGLLVFLVIFGMALLSALRHHDFLFLSFLIITATVCLSENLLDVNKGIFFYSFFLSFFLVCNKREDLNEATV